MQAPVEGKCRVLRGWTEARDMGRGTGERDRSPVGSFRQKTMWMEAQKRYS
jgi:hypothetical protein